MAANHGLPGTIKIQRRGGDREVPTEVLGATNVPDHNGGGYASRLTHGSSWDGHTRDQVEGHLAKWNVPAEIQAVADRLQRVLEDGVPDQKRTVLRNQEHGMLDDRWITEIAAGEEIDRPFTRWSKGRSDTIRVAICMSGAVHCMMSPEDLASRMAVACGLAQALESLDYSVSVVAGALRYGFGEGRTSPHKHARTAPRQATGDVRVFATVVKEESEPFVASGFAHFADTGWRRLVSCWTMKSNGTSGPLTDREWRDLTGADLLVWIGSNDTANSHGMPDGVIAGPVGPDTVRVQVSRMRDVDGAVKILEAFFIKLCGGEK